MSAEQPKRRRSSFVCRRVSSGDLEKPDEINQDFMGVCERAFRDTLEKLRKESDLDDTEEARKNTEIIFEKLKVSLARKNLNSSIILLSKPETLEKPNSSSQDLYSSEEASVKPKAKSSDYNVEPTDKCKETLEEVNKAAYSYYNKLKWEMEEWDRLAHPDERLFEGSELFEEDLDSIVASAKATYPWLTELPDYTEMIEELKEVEKKMEINTKVIANAAEQLSVFQEYAGRIIAKAQEDTWKRSHLGVLPDVKELLKKP